MVVDKFDQRSGEGVLFGGGTELEFRIRIYI